MLISRHVVDMSVVVVEDVSQKKERLSTSYLTWVIVENVSQREDE